MSRSLKFGWLLAAVLLLANFAMAARAFQETTVEWDPVCVWDGPEQQKAEMLGMFVMGTPLSALITLAILRRRRERVSVKISG